MSTTNQTSNNVPSSSDEPNPSRSRVLEARAEIVAEHVEANGTPAASKERQENAHSTSDEAKDRKKQISWWRRMFHHWKKPKTTQHHLPRHHGHKTDILFMPLDVKRVYSESVTGESTQPHADSERPTERET